jgi:hypothetical protein
LSEATGQFADYLVFPAAQLERVDAWFTEYHTVIRHRSRVIDYFGSMQQGLRWNTTNIQADAADYVVTLNKRHLESKVSGTKRGRITTWS